jgi:hypothetical protein
MNILGWNVLPEGYGLALSLDACPRWLKLWARLPLLDRFSYPVLVRRGIAYLVPHPSTPWQDPSDLEAQGWTVRPRTAGPAAPLLP